MSTVCYDIRYRIVGDGRTLEQAALMMSHQPLNETRASMEAQGYEFLQVIARDACATCQGNGRVRNGRRVGPLLSFKDCKACNGAGYVNEREIPLSGSTLDERNVSDLQAWQEVSRS